MTRAATQFQSNTDSRECQYVMGQALWTSAISVWYALVCTWCTQRLTVWEGHHGDVEGAEVCKFLGYRVSSHAVCCHPYNVLWVRDEPRLSVVHNTSVPIRYIVAPCPLCVSFSAIPNGVEEGVSWTKEVRRVPWQRDSASANIHQSQIIGSRWRCWLRQGREKRAWRGEVRGGRRGEERGGGEGRERMEACK